MVENSLISLDSAYTILSRSSVDAQIQQMFLGAPQEGRSVCHWKVEEGVSGGKTGRFGSQGLATPSPAYRCRGLMESVSGNWVLADVLLHLGLQGKAQPTPCFPPCETLSGDQLSHTVPRPQAHGKCEAVSGLCRKLISLWRFASASIGHSHR